MSSADIRRTWRRAPLLASGSPGWNYLVRMRRLPVFSINNALFGGGLREGSEGAVWALHQGASGQITGWETRGPCCREFSTPTGHSLLRVGEHIDTTRIAVTGSVIDALSLASIEGSRVGTLYASTGGGHAPAMRRALQVLLLQQVQLVWAGNRGPKGGLLAPRFHELARETGAAFARLRPERASWNGQLAAG